MALDETTGSSPETRRHRRRKKHPAIGSFQDAPSQAAAEAIAQNKGSHAPTPASDAGAREARRRARQARREAAQASKVALAHLQATLHENQLDPWRGMGPSPQEAGRQQYLSNLRDMPDYRTFDWKDARIPIMLSAGNFMPGMDERAPTVVHTSPRGVFQATVWDPDLPLWANLALGATWLTGPFRVVGGAFKGAHEAATAFKAAEEGAKITEKATQAVHAFAEGAQAGHAAPLKEGYRALKNRRIYRAGDAEVAIPAAGSHFGRSIEKVADAARPSLNWLTHGGIKSEMQRAGEELGYTLRGHQKIRAALANAIQSTGRRLTRAQSMAVAARLQGLTPAEMRVLHEQQAHALAQAGDNAGAAYQMNIAAILKKAEQYVERGPDEEIRFVAGGKKKVMERMYGLALRAGQVRDKILLDVGAASLQQLEGRIQAAGRVYMGGRYMSNERLTLEMLRSDPAYQQYAAMVMQFVPNDAGALLTEFENVIRAMATRGGNPMDVGGQLEHLVGTHAYPHGPLGDAPISTQDVPHLEANLGGAEQFYPEGELHEALPVPDIDSAAMAKDILKRVKAGDIKLPPHLSTPKKLANAIDHVHTLAARGAPYKDWYDRAGVAAQTIAERHGVTPDQAAQVLAIYSQASDTVANVSFVDQALKEFRDTGSVIKSGRFPTRQAPEADRVLRGEPWPGVEPGPKRSAFYANITGEDPESVTVDRWVVRMFDPKTKTATPGRYYEGFEQILQEMGHAMGWQPREVQAAAWVAIKGDALAQRFPKWSEKRVAREAGDAFEKGLANTAQMDLFSPPVGPGVRSPEERADAAVKLAQVPDGGFTLDRELRPYSGGGYAVAVPGHEAIMPVEELTPERLLAYADEKAELLANDEELKLGGWHDPESDQVYLDLSKVVKDKETAMRIGANYNQKAIFDFQTFESIPVSAGELAVKDYEALLLRVGKEQLGAKSNRLGRAQREQAEKILDDWAKANPDHPYAAQLEDLYMEQFRHKQPPEPEDLFDRSEFHRQAAEELEAYQALARDVARTLPEEEWPAWVRNAQRPSEKSVEFPPESKVSPMDRAPTPEEEAARARFEAGKPTGPRRPYKPEGPRFPTGNEDMYDFERAPQSFLYYRELVKHDPELVAKLTETPTPSTIISTARLALEKGDLKATDRLMGELHDKNVIPGQLTIDDARPAFRGRIGWIAGGYKDDPERITHAAMQFVHGEADEVTFVHEMAHFVRRFGLLPEDIQPPVAKFFGLQPVGETDNFGRPKSGQYLWDKDAEEKFAETMVGWLARGEGPAGTKVAFKALSKAIRGKLESEPGRAIVDMPPEVSALYRKLVSFEKPKGGRIVGAEDFVGGRIRVPFRRGVPVETRRDPVGALSGYIRVANHVFGGGRKSTIGAGPTDIALKKTFKGGLILSGRMNLNWEKALAEDLMLASRMEVAHRARAVLVQAGTDLPTDVTDVAVKVDPVKQQPEELKKLWETWDSLENGELKLTERDIAEMDAGMVERAKQNIFPEDIDGVDTKIVAARLMNGEIEEPIDNIVWVPREFIEETGLLYTPKVTRAGRFKGRGGRARGAGEMAFNTLNDVQRALILYLNPAYVPVNFLGNTVMNIMHQGVFYPRNMYRAAMAHRDLGYLERRTMDEIMGTGLTGSLMGKTRAMQAVNTHLGHWIQVATDMYPRRAAFMHEMANAGYKTPEQISARLKRVIDEGLDEEMDVIRRKANDAIVDFERLSPFEREVMTKVIFFYPWLKGATRWTARFALEHPMQAAALMIMGEHAFHESQDILGEEPWYAKTQVALNTRSLGVNIPGLGRHSLADAVGEHGYESGGLPMVMDVRQLLTATTPLDLLRAGVAFATGDKNAPQLVQNLTPVLYAGVVAGTGYDPFEGKEVDPGIRTFLSQMQNVPLKDRYEKIFMSPEERAQYHEYAYHPRSQQQEVERAFLSGLAPAPVNPEIGHQLAQEQMSTVARNKEKLLEDSKKYGLGPVPDQVLKEQELYYQMEDQLETGQPDHEQAMIAAKLYDQAYGGTQMQRLAGQIQNEGQAHALYLQLRGAMFPYFYQWRNQISKMKEAEGAAVKVP